MSRWRRAAARLVVAGLGLFGQAVRAQSLSLSISPVRSDSIAPAPNMSVVGVQTRPELGPYTVTLELSTESVFSRPFYVNAAEGVSAVFTLDSLLAEKTPIFFRARLIDSSGTVVAEVQQRHVVQTWLRLTAPLQQNLVQLTSSRPRFIWSSPIISLPAGPWSYALLVFNSATGEQVQFAPVVRDTSFMFPDPLESNTPYRWQVTARGQNSRGTGEVTVRSMGTFVVSSEDQPSVTLLYQNFPNPFGRGQLSAFTCFWIDLARPSKIELTIYDIRLRRVRRLIPGTIGDITLPAGIHGRPAAENVGGCDPRFSWDGRDDDGRYVPPGVYVAEFRGDGVRTTRKMLFKGP